MAAAAPPPVLLHPVGQHATAGDRVILATAGDPRFPATFQWYRDGVAIPGATSPNLLIRNTGPADEATYHAVLRNADGESHTRPATVRLHLRTSHPGATDTTFLAPLFSPGSQLKAVATDAGGNVFAGGDFTVPGALTQHLIKLGPGGEVAPAFAPHTAPPDDQVRALHLYDDGRLLVAGDFTRINNHPVSRIARLMPDGSLDPTFRHELGADNDISDVIVLPDGKILIAGRFLNVRTSAGWTGRAYLTRLGDDGQPDLTFATLTAGGGPVTSIAIAPGGTILAGGSFTRAGGEPYPRVARFLADGSLDYSFFRGAGPNLPVRTVHVDSSGRPVIGGDFRSVHGVPRERLARLRQDGSVDTAFDAPCDLPVRHICDHPDGGLLVAGRFTSIAGQAFRRIAHLDGDGNVRRGFETYGIDEEVRVLHTTADGRLLAAGDFARPHSHLLRLHLRNPLPSAPKVLTNLPESIHVDSGSTARLSVTASAYPPPAYQWFRAGVPVPGATGPELLLPAVSGAETGVYAVSVSNSAGMVTSSFAELTASPPLPAATTTCTASVTAPLAVPAGTTTLAEIPVAEGFTVGRLRAEIALEHPASGLLDIDLISPAGEIVELFDGDERSGRHLAKTTFDDTSPFTVASAQPPDVGTFRPAEPLSGHAGSPSAGTWRLRVRDDRSSGPDATLHAFHLHFDRPQSAPTFENYTANFYLEPDPALDANGDGYSNFTAFAFLAAPDRDLHPVRLLAPGEISHPAWTAPDAPTYTYEASGDLGSWNPVAPSKTYTTLYPDHRSTLTLTFDPPPAYLRVRATDTSP